MGGVSARPGNTHRPCEVVSPVRVCLCRLGAYGPLDVTDERRAGYRNCVPLFVTVGGTHGPPRWTPIPTRRATFRHLRIGSYPQALCMNWG